MWWFEREKKKIVLIETDNSFCHWEIFNSVMGFKENKQDFNILTLHLLPLLALCNLTVTWKNEFRLRLAL